MGQDTESLIRTLSQDRFETYKREAGHNNEERAFKLYLWNIRIGGAFFLPLHVVEIGLRNAINRALVDRYSVNYAELMTLVHWLEPAMHAWIEPHCRVSALICEKP